jgi:hypothetical protein
LVTLEGWTYIVKEEHAFVLKPSSVHINHGRGSCLMLSKALGWSRNQNAGTTTTRLPPRMGPVYLVIPLTSLGNVPYIGLLTPTLLSLGSHYHSPIPGAGWINSPDKKAHSSRIHWHTTKNSAHSIIITKISLNHYTSWQWCFRGKAATYMELWYKIVLHTKQEKIVHSCRTNQLHRALEVLLSSILCTFYRQRVLVALQSA